jgi:hypothetical protein
MTIFFPPILSISSPVLPSYSLPFNNYLDRFLVAFTPLSLY